MFFKNNKENSSKSVSGKNNASKKTGMMSIITKDMNILGNIVSDGKIDFEGTLDGNIHCQFLTVRADGKIKGEIVADDVFVHGSVNGLIRAKNVHLLAGCTVEGIIMHETLSIEDGASVDGKFKRTDRLKSSEEDESSDGEANLLLTFEGSKPSEAKVLENIRLIR